jgi:hypothetical protein
MKCYSDFKNTFYKQNRDSISGGEQSIKVWILNDKRKSIQYDGQNDLEEPEPIEVGSGN